MELHTLGVDGGYTQKDVQEVARAFTGWTIANPRPAVTYRFEPRLHDDGEKVVLGHRIKAGGGKKDGERGARSAGAASVDGAVHRDQAGAPVRRRRAAAGARRAGRGQLQVDRRRHPRSGADDRDLAGVLRRADRAKTKNPFEFVVSAVRVTGLDVANALPLVQSLRDLGMPLYGAQPPTGYADKAEAWVNSGALLNRMNFAVALTAGQLAGARRPRPPYRPPTSGRRRDSRLFTTALANEVSESTAATVRQSEHRARRPRH